MALLVSLKDDYTVKNLVLDAELKQTPKSGLYLNFGLHPSITIDNLLAFLPFPDIQFDNYSNSKTYGVYNVTLDRTDIVRHAGKLWQSILGSNTNHTPGASGSELYWMETNLESLKLKSFISRVVEKAKQDLNLVKRLVNNQFIYETTNLKDSLMMLPNDFNAWVFEPKGSDYLTITLNQISLKASGTDPVTIYVLNQDRLVETIEVIPSNGKLEFKDLNYSFYGPGRWMFVIESQEVYTNRSLIDPLQFDGFVCYTATGIGSDVEDVEWNFGTIGNGLNFNVSCHLNSDLYIENNLHLFGKLLCSTFELMAFEMFLANSNNRSNRNERIQLDKDALIAETKSLDMNTSAKRYYTEKRKAEKLIQKTFDTQLSDTDDFEFEISSI